jgi:ribose transport system substrate-binding protein
MPLGTEHSTKKEEKIMKLKIIGAAAVLAAALALSGCSSGAGGASSSSGLSTAQLTAFASAAQKGAAPTAYKGPSSSPSIVPGQKIAVILCAAAAEGCVRIGKGIQEATAVVGWTEKSYDGQGQASVQSSAMQQAITEGATGIVLVAIDAHAVGQGMSAAKTANVPVVSVVGGNAIGTGEGQVAAQPSAQAEQAGANLANWVVSETKGKLKVAMFHAPEFADSILRYNGSKKVFDSCSSCSIVSDTTYTAATAAQQIPLQTKSILQAHPDINYVWIDIGGIGESQVQAIDQANLGSKVKLVSFDCNALDVKNIRAGDVQVACEGLGLEAGGWGAVDSFNRVFAKQPVSMTYIPIRTIDKSNLPSGAVYTGDYDYQAIYTKMWGK